MKALAAPPQCSKNGRRVKKGSRNFSVLAKSQKRFGNFEFYLYLFYNFVVKCSIFQITICHICIQDLSLGFLHVLILNVLINMFRILICSRGEFSRLPEEKFSVLSRGEFSRSETRLEYVFYRTARLRRIPRNASFLNSRTPCLCFFLHYWMHFWKCK